MRSWGNFGQKNHLRDVLAVPSVMSQTLPWILAAGSSSAEGTGLWGHGGKAFPQAAGEARGSGNHGTGQGPPAGLRQEAAQVK